MKKQVIFIHGGDSFETRETFLDFLRKQEFDPYEQRGKRWKETMAEELEETHEILMPSFPARDNADYEAWKIWLEKLLPHIHDDVILIGYSLGGSFLIKYLSEHNFPKRISKLYLVAPALEDEDGVDGGVGDFAPDPAKLENLGKQVSAITIYHSTDDPVVPYTQSEELQKHVPNAGLVLFEDRHHFIQETFPEIVEDIKSL